MKSSSLEVRWLGPVLAVRPQSPPAASEHPDYLAEHMGYALFTLAEIALGCIAVQGNNVGSNLQLVEIVSP
jgi:hypothetical protein